MTMKRKEKLETKEGQMDGVRRLFDHAIFILNKYF
jgi:hypothetical protein